MKRSLSEWLKWQEKLHLSEIDLGLERIGKVAKKLNLLNPNIPIITLAGTNGKGSSVALLESILRAQGYKTGAYTSPHLLRYNERIAIDNIPASDAQIINAFEQIDDAREDISLTYFEFGTLAAMLCFIEQKVDVIILEVGLGGRLDTSNLWDATLAIITGIAIDHVAWLGNNREKIAIEKSGIMRKSQPVISGDPNPPDSIQAEAQRIGATLYQFGNAFSYKKLNANDLNANAIDKNLKEQQWQWKGWETSWNNQQSITLPLPALQGEFQLNNAANVIAGLHTIKNLLPVSPGALEEGLKTVTLSGRMQILKKNPEWLLDVAHNPQSAEQLAEYLNKNPVTGKTHAIFSMLGDKDIKKVINLMDEHIDTWHITKLEGNRGLETSEINALLSKTLNTATNTPVENTTNNQSFNTSISHYQDFDAICKQLKKIAKNEDRVVAFGSFLVVSAVMEVCTN